MSDKDILYEENHGPGTRKKIVFILSTVFILLCIVGVTSVVVYVVIDTMKIPSEPSSCRVQTEPCVFTLVESMPENLTYPVGSPSHLSTFDGIQKIINKAQETIEIASFYWTMRGEDLPVSDPSDWQGERLFDDLVLAGKEKGIKIRIVQSKPKQWKPIPDTLYLAKNAGAEVRSLDFDRLLGSGILHTKMWLVDRKHFYVGSANLDWRSFTQVKEIGGLVEQCSCLGTDIGKIFDAYWYLAEPNSSIPSEWPQSYNTLYNSNNTMVVNFNKTIYNTFLSSSPPPICPTGRSQDGKTIVEIISSADKFVHIAVMDYFASTQFQHPRSYWPVIDDALRSAAFDRQIEVRLLASFWNHTGDEMFVYLHSLQDLKYHSNYLNINIQVKMFVVPAYTEAQKNIPFARVNHNKYMVTDKTAYIGTSNWSGDYFIKTAGIGLVIHKSEKTGDIRQQLADVFERDWNSEYAHDLSSFNKTMYS